MKTETQLSKREQEYLEHIERAKACGQKLAQYCREVGINAQALSALRENRKDYFGKSETVGVPAHWTRRDLTPLEIK
jgi:hypothetical protein